MAGAMAARQITQARSRHGRGVRRQPRRGRAQRLSLSASGHRTDRGESPAGGAAINQIAKLACAELRVVPIALDRPTRDFTVATAMDVDEFLSAVDIGYRTVPEDGDLLAIGEMGIANTTTAALLCAAMLGGGAARWAGRGTGVDDQGLARKREAIEAALDCHRDILADPLAVAAALGGRELDGDGWRHSGGAAAPDTPSCSMALWPHQRSCRWRGLMPVYWITAAPGMSPRNPDTVSCCGPNSASTHCSISACGLARAPAPAWRFSC